MTARTGLAAAVMVASASLATFVGLPMAVAQLRALLPLVPDALARIAAQ